MKRDCEAVRVLGGPRLGGGDLFLGQVAEEIRHGAGGDGGHLGSLHRLRPRTATTFGWGFTMRSICAASAS